MGNGHRAAGVASSAKWREAPTSTSTSTWSWTAPAASIVTFATNGAWNAKCKCNSSILLNFMLRAQSAKSQKAKAHKSLLASALELQLQFPWQLFSVLTLSGPRIAIGKCHQENAKMAEPGNWQPGTRTRTRTCISLAAPHQLRWQTHLLAFLYDIKIYLTIFRVSLQGESFN